LHAAGGIALFLVITSTKNLLQAGKLIVRVFVVREAGQTA